MDRIKLIALTLAALLTQAQADINISQPFTLSGSAGSSGQVFTSQGAGAVPIWTTPSAGGGAPGGLDSQFQYNNGGVFGGITPMTYDDSGLAVTAKVGNSFFFVDPTTISKRFNFDASNIASATTRTVNIPNANSTTVQADSGAPSQFFTAMSAQGVFTRAQPTYANISGTIPAVTSIATTSPVQGGTITGTGTISLNLAADFAWTAAQSMTLTNASTNTSDTVLQVIHNSTALGTSTGFGTTYWSRLENGSGTTNQDAGQIQNNWATSTGGSETSEWLFLLRNNGAALATKAKITGAGAVDASDFTVLNTSVKLPASGQPGQVLEKNTAVNYDVSWQTPPQFNVNTSTGGQLITTSDTYVTGSVVTIPAGEIAVGSTYHVLIHMSKTAAGTIMGPFILRVGTNGTTADTAAVTMWSQTSTGTAVADTATIEFYATFTTAGASAIVRTAVIFLHSATTTGFVSTGGSNIIPGSLVVSGAFNASSATKIGVSYAGGTSAQHTLTVLKADYFKP